MGEIYKTLLLKTGPIGLLLLWSMMENKSMMEKLFLLIEADIKAKTEMCDSFARLSEQIKDYEARRYP